MKYTRLEAKEAAREMLRGVWTALPTSFLDADRLDEKGIGANLDHAITHLKIDGHYCIGNVGEFRAMTNEERMRVAEINVDVNRGRVPLIAGCHHQNPLEAARLARHAQDIGMVGGRVRVPCAEMSDENKALMKADLEATGLIAKARAGTAASADPRRAR